MAVEGWGEKKFVPRGRLTVKNKGRGGDGAGGGGRFRVSPKLWQSAVRASWFCSKNTTYMKILPHKPTCLPDRMFCFFFTKQFDPKHLISPNGITPKSKSMVMGIKEMITSSKFS